MPNVVSLTSSLWNASDAVFLVSMVNPSRPAELTRVIVRQGCPSRLGSYRRAFCRRCCAGLRWDDHAYGYGLHDALDHGPTIGHGIPPALQVGRHATHPFQTAGARWALVTCHPTNLGLVETGAKARLPRDSLSRYERLGEPR